MNWCQIWIGWNNIPKFALFASPKSRCCPVHFLWIFLFSGLVICLRYREWSFVQHFDTIVISICATRSWRWTFIRRNFGRSHRLHFKMRCRHRDRQFIVMLLWIGFITTGILIFAYFITNVTAQFLWKYKFLTTEIASAAKNRLINRIISIFLFRCT